MVRYIPYSNSRSKLQPIGVMFLLWMVGATLVDTTKEGMIVVFDER